jgi:hypothetical protein
LNRTSADGEEGFFKNEFIDTIKSKHDNRFMNKFDKEKVILDEERYYRVDHLFGCSN